MSEAGPPSTPDPADTRLRARVLIATAIGVGEDCLRLREEARRLIAESRSRRRRDRERSRADSDAPTLLTEGPAVAKRRVLIVEDHPQTRAVMAKTFGRKGWAAMEAGTLAEGLAMLDPPPDCIVLDLMLPDGDGEAILRKVREDELPTSVVTIVTGLDDVQRLGEVAKLRPEALLMKPMNVDVIFRLCASEMGGRPG